MTELTQNAVRQFQGKVCQCGRPKHERQPFCFTCWNALEDFPGRNKLPHLTETEFAWLYFRCCDYLKTKVAR